MCGFIPFSFSTLDCVRLSYTNVDSECGSIQRTTTSLNVTAAACLESWNMRGCIPVSFPHFRLACRMQIDAASGDALQRSGPCRLMHVILQTMGIQLIDTLLLQYIST
jgi:hypothetical protein